MTAPRSFLTTNWLHLAMLNYRVAPELLQQYVPAGTELDTWQGHAYLSVVGLLFRDTRVLGVPVPFHRHFEEVNLRCYVRREVAGEVRRAVTFLRELVPRRAIAAVARLAYNEPYTVRTMRHAIGPVDDASGAPATVEYAWRQNAGWSRLVITPGGAGAPARPGSQEEFITEHYWGYTRQRDGGTVEYRVRHASWRVWQAQGARLEGELASLYGADVAAALASGPDSAFLANGSAVTIFAPQRLSHPASPFPSRSP
jgi:hypothetical protein